VKDMLLTTVQESDPIYQFCEGCVDKYIDTLDESYITAILEDKDDDDWKIVSSPGAYADDFMENMAKDAANLSSNPFKAYKKVMDMDSDFASRAEGIGVHQPQKKMMAFNTFISHPNTQRGIKVMLRAPLVYGAYKGIKSIYDYERFSLLAISSLYGVELLRIAKD
jgi:hypothetical protein